MVTKYSQNVPVYFGNGAVKELGDRVKELGCKKVMCVYDAGVKAAGASVKAEESLKAAGIEYVVYDKITADPADYLVNECATMAKEAGVDAFVGIGGGSSMDCAKAAAMLLDRELPIEQYFTAPPSFYKVSVPIILVPTTAGTGSECTTVAVISSGGAKPSVFVNTAMAVVDPELTYTVPAGVTANTGLDAFTHAAEALTALKANPRSDLLAQSAIEKITKYLPIAVKEPTNAEARYNLALASNWAGIAFADTDCHLGHCLADGLSSAFHTPHGWNCILFDPQLMKLCAQAVPAKVAMVGIAAGADIAEDATPDEIGAATADAIYALMKAAGLKGPKSYNMDRTAFIEASKLCMDIDLGLRLNCPVEPTAEICAEIYANAYDCYE